jgi:hypothetical protein
LLKVALSTITLTLTHKSVIEDCSCINAIFIYIHVGLVITVYLYTCWPCYYCIFIYMLALLLLYIYIHVGLVITVYLYTCWPCYYCIFILVGFVLFIFFNSISPRFYFRYVMFATISV